ncbi:MAG TPA: hypothetical protein VHT94_07330 [Streptosporangiaceae bacterium]|nr:hypothetical protein [Streptosporangiaceae bacterium]
MKPQRIPPSAGDSTARAEWTRRLFRRHPQRFAGERLTVALYSPPLARHQFEALRGVADLSGDADVAEVTFRSGKRVLLAYCARYVTALNAYVTVEPGRYLAYDHATGYLSEASDADLADYDQGGP